MLRSSAFRPALAVASVLAFVAVAAYAQSVLAGLSLWFLPKGAASSAYFVAAYLLTRVVAVAVVARAGAALSPGSERIVLATATAILAVFVIVQTVDSREPVNWTVHGGLLALVIGALLGLFSRQKGSAGAATAA